jgi:hypothetical protein
METLIAMIGLFAGANTFIDSTGYLRKTQMNNTMLNDYTQSQITPLFTYFSKLPFCDRR